MSRAIGLALCGLWMAALAACSAPAVDEGAGLAAATWRHWQPGALARPSGPVSDAAIASEATIVSEAAQASASPATAEAPKAVVLALHGFNDYSNAFQDFAAYGSARGVAVHAYDQRGFGAQPDRGRWPGTDRLVRDLRDAVAGLRGIYGATPLFVLGESMGGAVAIVAATGDEALDVDGLILSAPAVWGGSHLNPFYRLTLWLASSLAPGWALTPSGLDIHPSDNIEMLRAFSADPMVIKATRTDAVAGLVRLMDRAIAAAPRLDRKVLLLIGEKDEIVPPAALDDFRSRLTIEGAETKVYPEGYHMLLRDLQRARVFEDILAWIDRETEASAVDARGRTGF